MKMTYTIEMFERAVEPRFTYGEYVQWQGDNRWELIDGIAFDMSPAPSRLHQDVVLGVGRQLADKLEGGPGRVYLAPFDVRLPEADEDDDEIITVVQPDVSVICDASKLDRAGCRGAPDFILEVGSPRTAVRDRLQKRALYERHGVREYWIIDPDERELLVYRLDPATGLFGEPRRTEAKTRTAVAVFQDLAIDWRRVLF